MGSDQVCVRASSTRGPRLHNRNVVLTSRGRARAAGSVRVIAWRCGEWQPGSHARAACVGQSAHPSHVVASVATRRKGHDSRPNQVVRPSQCVRYPQPPSCRCNTDRTEGRCQARSWERDDAVASAPVYSTNSDFLCQLQPVPDKLARSTRVTSDRSRTDGMQ